MTAVQNIFITLRLQPRNGHITTHKTTTCHFYSLVYVQPVDSMFSVIKLRAKQTISRLQLHI